MSWTVSACPFECIAELPLIVSDRHFLFHLTIISLGKSVNEVSQFCSPKVEYPKSFHLYFFAAVYLPPQTDTGTKTALKELYKAKRKQENAHPEAVLLVARDFNAGKQIRFTSFLPAC
jgi:hypothetical protein